MKSIEQLLDLLKNPYYGFTDEERAAIDAFLLKKQGTALKKSRKKSSTKSSEKTNVRVRNIVKKTDTYPPEYTG